MRYIYNISHIFIMYLVLVGVTYEMPRVTPRDIIESNFHIQNVWTCTNKPGCRHPFTGGREEPTGGRTSKGTPTGTPKCLQFSCIFIPPCLKDHNPGTDLKSENAWSFWDSGYGFSPGFIRKCRHTTLHYYVWEHTIRVQCMDEVERNAVYNVAFHSRYVAYAYGFILNLN